MLTLRGSAILSKIRSILFFNEFFEVPSMQMSVAELYHRFQDEDNFLYMTYASTEMFG